MKKLPLLAAAFAFSACAGNQIVRQDKFVDHRRDAAMGVCHDATWTITSTINKETSELESVRHELAHDIYRCP